MPNRDGIVSIGFDYKKDLEKMIKDFEAEMNAVSNNTQLSKGMKKKASLTKLSYGNLTTRNKVQMKTINHNHSKVYSYLSPRTQAKSERFMTLTNSGSKYNNKVNKQKKFIH